VGLLEQSGLYDPSEVVTQSVADDSVVESSNAAPGAASQLDGDSYVVSDAERTAAQENRGPSIPGATVPLQDGSGSSYVASEMPVAAAGDQGSEAGTKATDIAALASGGIAGATGVVLQELDAQSADVPASTVHGGGALQSDGSLSQIGTRTPLEGSPADVQAATQLILENSAVLEDASEVPITEASAIGTEASALGGTTNGGVDSV
jgi:hypothetical protein